MMSKNKIPDMTPICDKCHKVAPIDQEKSNNNWIVYNVKEPCECGGRFRPKHFVLNNDDSDKNN